MRSLLPPRRTHGPTAAPVEKSPFALVREDWAAMGQSWLSSWKAVATGRSLPQDLLSGLTVAAVALPLNLALAVASGMPASAGLVAGAVGGLVAGHFGGSSLQVTGPAAALSVMVLALAQRFGVVGVAAACLIIGAIQVVLSFTRAGHLGKLVPESVLAGFTTGVGLKLLDSQLPELLGFDLRVVEIAAMMHRPEWLKEVNWLAAVSGLFVAFLVVAMRPYKRFPASIIGVALVTFVANYVDWDIARVGEVPSTLPPFAMPLIPDEAWLDLIIATLPLAFLASVESLLSASAVDRMAKDLPPHQPSLELFGQGLANLAVGFLSGMPVTGVVVRSGLNVQSGARTRVATIAHGVILLGSVLLLSTSISRVPLAALAGLLCVIGFRLVEVGTLVHLARHERVEALAFALTCAGTVTGHLMGGLVAGLTLHFANRLRTRNVDAERKQIAREIEHGVRAMVPASRSDARMLKPHTTPSMQPWLPHLRATPRVASTAFVHPQASVLGPVVLSDHVHIAAGSSVRADEGAPFFIGPDSNIQDGVVIHALRDRRVMVGAESWAVFVGRNVSLAHDCLVHGPCFIGDDSFVGFKSVVHDSIVGRHCFIGIGAIVVGVEIPDGRFVPHGTIVDTREKAERLPPADEAQHHFNEDVVDVNRGLAAAYRSLLERTKLPPRRALALQRHF